MPILGVTHKGPTPWRLMYRQSVIVHTETTCYLGLRYNSMMLVATVLCSTHALHSYADSRYIHSEFSLSLFVSSSGAFRQHSQSSLRSTFSVHESPTTSTWDVYQTYGCHHAGEKSLFVFCHLNISWPDSVWRPRGEPPARSLSTVSHPGLYTEPSGSASQCHKFWNRSSRTLLSIAALRLGEEDQEL